MHMPTLSTESIDHVHVSSDLPKIYKVFDNPTSANPVQVNAFGNKVVEAFQKFSKYNIKPRVVVKEAMDKPINHYISDDDAARACGIAYKDALISGKFWSDDDLVKDWFGDLEDPQSLTLKVSWTPPRMSSNFWFNRGTDSVRETF